MIKRQNVRIEKKRSVIFAKALSALLAVFMILSASSCSTGSAGQSGGAISPSGAADSAETENTDKSNDKNADRNTDIEVVTTIFPVYDWVREVSEGGSAADVVMLLDSGVDLHSFQPSVDDIARISECDLFIYVGGESDKWVADALNQPVNPDRRVLNLMELLGSDAKEEEIVEGMQEPDEDDGDDNADNDSDGDDEKEYDEHVWLSLKNAGFFVNEIAEALSEIDPVNRSVYVNNAKNYSGLLSDLDDQYKEAVSDASVRTLLFADRFPFRYMTDDYGLDYYAPFAGCSAETEASFKTVAFLTDKLNELGLKYVMVTESSDKKIADTIIDNSESKDQEILVLDSMQSVTAEDVKNGAGYIDIMEGNLSNLKKALSVKKL